MIEVVILAIALSMDAFAVSVGLGAKQKSKTATLAVMCGLYFGLFQALMPMVGYLGGKSLLGWIASYSSWVAFGLLLLIGAKMIYESFSEGIEEDIAKVTHRIMIVLAVATSIDAMAAGFTLNLFKVNPFLACMIIGITTFFFSFLGVYVGRKSGNRFESKAELFGGVILVLIGLKILID